MHSKNAFFYHGVFRFSVLLDLPAQKHYRYYCSFRGFPDIEGKENDI
jgi:hypothetical protein